MCLVLSVMKVAGFKEAADISIDILTYNVPEKSSGPRALSGFIKNTAAWTSAISGIEIRDWFISGVTLGERASRTTSSGFGVPAVKSVL